MLTQKELESLVAGLVNERRMDRGLSPIEVPAETAILDGALEVDSLDLAAIVVELQEKTGFDPFAGGFIAFRTVAELAALFAGASRDT